jgi:hypothetical protein
MELVRKFGPYLAVELLLPGGTLIALALYLYRNRRNVLGCEMYETDGAEK